MINLQYIIAVESAPLETLKEQVHSSVFLYLYRRLVIDYILYFFFNIILYVDGRFYKYIQVTISDRLLRIVFCFVCGDNKVLNLFVFVGIWTIV